MICNKCGSNIDENSTICPLCGNKIKEKKIEEKTEVVETTNSNQPIETTPTTSEAQIETVPNEIVENQVETIDVPAEIPEQIENTTTPSEQPIETTPTTNEQQIETVPNEIVENQVETIDVPAEIPEQIENSTTTSEQPIEEEKEEQIEETNNEPVPIMMETEVNNNTPTINTNDNNIDNLKVLSTISSILGFILFPFSIIGIITGIKVFKETNKKPIGILLGVISLIVQIIAIALIVIFVIKPDNNTQQNTNEQKIGNNYLGYLTISNDWNLYKDTDGTSTLQYQYKTTNTVLSLYVILDPSITINDYANSIKDKLKTYGGQEISHEVVNVGNYTAIKQQGFLTTLNQYMTTWCFSDENGNFHYISINSDNQTDHLEIVKTFSLK